MLILLNYYTNFSFVFSFQHWWFYSQHFYSQRSSYRYINSFTSILNILCNKTFSEKIILNNWNCEKIIQDLVFCWPSKCVGIDFSKNIQQTSKKQVLLECRILWQQMDTFAKWHVCKCFFLHRREKSKKIEYLYIYSRRKLRKSTYWERISKELKDGQNYANGLVYCRCIHNADIFLSFFSQLVIAMSI